MCHLPLTLPFLQCFKSSAVSQYAECCFQLTAQACRSESLWLNSFFVCFNCLSQSFRLNYGKRCEKQINVKQPRKTLRLITVMCVCSQLLDYKKLLD